VIQCPTCKQILETGVRFCPNDGTPLTETSAMSTVPTPTGNRPPRSVDIALPVTVGGRYRLEEKRGGGGMAKVYRAIDTNMDREVAVKLINQELRSDPEFDARFQREARIASQLADPHIVVVHDYGLDPVYGPFLVMEYLKGETLRERLATGGKLPYKAGLQLGGQMLLALIHAHDKGVVHRDIKPDNVFLLNQSGVRLHLRVLDFGIARIFKKDDPAKAETLTSVGAVLGTPRYMSPEQLAGQPVDARSDLYSAALVIHEGLTGQLPFVSGKPLNELCPEATPSLQELLYQCLKPNPAERPASALEVYLRLQELGKASGILLLPPGALEKIAGMRKANSSGEIAVHSEPTQPRAAAPPRRLPYLLTRGPRRVLIGFAACLALLGAAMLIKTYFFAEPPPTPPTGPESLLGVKIGDDQNDAEDKIHLHQPDDGKNPLEKEKPLSMGRHLWNKLLTLAGDEARRVKVASTSKDELHIVFVDRKVRGVVLTQAYPNGETGRGVKIGSSEDDLNKRYANVEPMTQENGVRWYDGLGVAFEIRGSKVTGIALYPPVKPPQP
jgi:serine/threonine protein kinase